MAIFHKDDNHLGVDIGAHGIKLVELRSTKGRPQLWTYGTIDEKLNIHVDQHHEKTPDELRDKPGQMLKKPGDAEEVVPKKRDNGRIEHYGALLRELVKQTKVTAKRATASLPVSYVFHTVLTLPHVPAKEVGHHVKAKVAKMLPRPIDEMQVVHQVIPSGEKEEAQKYIRVLVTAAPKDLILFYTGIFQQAGIELEELETEAFALERSLVGRDTATVMVVDIGAERTNFFIMDQGLPMTHRSIQLGGKTFDRILQQHLGVDEKVVGQLKYDMMHMQLADIPQELFAASIDPMIKEIQYGFDLFLHQTGNEQKRPEKIILTGGSAVFPPIAAQLANAFSMKVFVGDPWARVVYQQGLKHVLDTLGPRMAVSIGLALRNIV